MNKDTVMIWREDRGKSKLVPLHPKGAEESATLKMYTTADVAKCNTLNKAWIVIDERVYDITNFVAKHPGGEKVLLNVLGKDCTDAFANYHSAVIYKKWLPPYLIGRVTDIPVYPHVKDFRDIRQELLKMGHFETNPMFYYKLYAWFATLFLTSLYLTICCQSMAAHMLGSAVMGLFWQQLAGWAHDIGHSAITHDCQYDNFIGSTIGCVFMGVSLGWWKRNHNTHHIVSNSIEHDPDIQHMPLLAITPAIMQKPFWSSYHKKVFFVDAATRFFIRHQHWFFITIMMVARLNLYVQSIILILTTANQKDAIVMYYRSHEIVSLIVFFTWVISLACSLPTWTETAACMDTYHGNAYNDASDEWYIMQIKTTMNIDCYDWMDWFHIGLQFQIEHHLFPTLPRHNLPIAKKMVKECCKKHDIKYSEHMFIPGVIKTLMCLRETALRARNGDFDYVTSTTQIRDLLNANG